MLAWRMMATAGAVSTVIATTLLAMGDGIAQAPPTPKARYWIDASTVSGFMGNPMAAMLGGGSGEQRELVLRLGSTLAPAGGAPKADHFMPPAMRLGASVPLYTPPPPGPGKLPQPGQPEFKRPKGRLLIYWGCGAKAGPGQPVVLDFSRLAAGQVPPNLFTANVPVERGPSIDTSRTYGNWPNAMERKPKKIDRGASLLGDHRIAGNYSPDIAFTLQRDFMPALNARSAAVPDGSTMLSWNMVGPATGYYAWAMGGKSMGEDSADMVWWTSAGRQEFGAGLWDWLSPATVSRLVTQKIVMPPAQTSCAIPAEVKTAAGGMMMGFMYAYGPEQEFAFPPRPANPKTPWRPEWTAKARFRSTTTVMLGMPGMNDMGDAADNERPEQRKKCKPSLGGMLGGALGGALGRRGC
jgi:hypothetical protein